MFQEVRSRLPSMAAWIEFSYGSQPILLFGDFQLLSCTGVQQGDPLGPLCFALTLHPLIERIQSAVPDLCLNAWYLDDGTFCGPSHALSAALEIIDTHGPPRGLFLNKGKSLLSAPSGAEFNSASLLAGIPITSQGYTLLGCPIGPPSYCLNTVSKRVEKIQSVLAHFPDLHDSQIELALQRSCLSLPKISFALRTCPPDFIYPALTAFDNLMRETLSHIVGSPLSNWSWSKASLPSSLGGINLRSATLHSPATYISSLHHSCPLVSEILGFHPSPPAFLRQAIHDLGSSLGQPEWSDLSEIEPPLRQRSLSRAIDLFCHNSLLESAPDIRSKALAHSTAIRHACDWLNVIPSPALGLHMFDHEFRPCLRYWLGLPLFPADSKCSICHSPADRFGDHHVGCGGNSDRIHRHNSIRDAIFSAAQTAALAPRRELPHLIPNRQSRPADIFLPSWDRGRPAALDISVISTLQNLTVQRAASTPGHALQVGELRKRTLHDAPCAAVGVSFLPILFESLGGLSSLSATTISTISRHLGQRIGSPPADTKRHLFQRCSITLWRGNAALWLNRMSTVSSRVDGII